MGNSSSKKRNKKINKVDKGGIQNNTPNLPGVNQENGKSPDDGTEVKKPPIPNPRKGTLPPTVSPSELQVEPETRITPVTPVQPQPPKPTGVLPLPPRPPAQARKQMRALYAFEKQVEGDLSFQQDDILELIDSSDDFWWKMYNPQTKEAGFVPYNYVQPFDGGPTSLAAWFEVDRREAERNLLMPGLPDGTYLLRPCRQKSDKATYSLSIRIEEGAHEGKEVVVKHYMIKTMDSGGFYISPSKTFPTIQTFVDHYKSDKDGLCAPLVNPCPRKYVPPPHFRDFELNRKQLTMVCKLGNGSFGEVWKAKLGKLVEVAVKQMITSGQGIAMNKDDFIREAETMQKLHHPKIVQLLGVCTNEEPFYIITELMPNGALLSYLRNDNKNGRTIRFENMLDMMFQIADGMAYLEEKKFIHRDLRAANILVGHDNIVKVADFGLSRLVEEEIYDVTEKTQFPIRWTAPEAATTKSFTTKSDVWSFGILIYEIVTRGGAPYPEYKNADILRIVSEGYRMPKPNKPEFGMECEDFLYNKMLDCWKANPQDRPTFVTLRGIFESYDVEKQQQYA